jgi:DNA mismatch repair ATPase MutS
MTKYQIQEIKNLQEQIHDLKEYLYSDLCKSCGDAAIELDKISQILSELEAEQNS